MLGTKFIVNLISIHELYSFDEHTQTINRKLAPTINCSFVNFKLASKTIATAATKSLFFCGKISHVLFFIQ